MQKKGEKMRILIIEDTICKRREIEEVLTNKGIEFISVEAINPAKKILNKKNFIDGIVIDMVLPIYENEFKTMKENGGEILLKWLEHKRKKIPALGNSVFEFDTKYAYFAGQMYGMYDSKIFPWSVYCTGTEGKDPGFDPLEIMVSEAHYAGLKIEAWINPYRVKGTSNTSKIAKSSPAYEWLDTGKVIVLDNGIYYNPLFYILQD